MSEPTHSIAIASLLQDLHHNNPAMRARAADSLSTIGPAAHEAVPSLVSLLNDSSEDVRARSAWALFKIGSDETAVPALVQGLKDPSKRVRFFSARGLVTVRPSPKAALSALIEALVDDSPIPDTARWALQVIGPDSVPPLAAVLKSPDPRWRFQAAAALSSRTPERARLAIPLLLDALNDSHPFVRRLAAQSLGDIGWACRDSIEALGERWIDIAPALSRLLREGDADIRSTAAMALSRLGPEAHPALSILLDALTDEDERTRRFAAEAVNNITSSRGGDNE